MTTKIFTIGFTKKTAGQFFQKLRDARVKRLIDTRLNRKSQLAGFAKETDLPFFLQELLGADYIQEPLTAPTESILKAYKARKMTWEEYEKEYRTLIEARHVERHLRRDLLTDACLLCSEDKPHHCHRRLLAEYLAEKWGEVEITHL